MASLGFSLGFGAQSNEDKRYFELLSNAAKKREIANLPGATNAQKSAAKNAENAAQNAAKAAGPSLSRSETTQLTSLGRHRLNPTYSSLSGGKRSRRTRRNRTRRTRRNRKY